MRALRITLIAALLGAAVSPAVALSGKLGVQVMGVGNSLTGELPAEGSWKGETGLGGGLLAELDLTTDVSLSLQPSYAPRASRQEFKQRGEVIGAIDYAFDYLSIPLVVRVTGHPLGARGFVTAGLDLNILLEATYDAGQGETDISDGLNSTSLAAFFGAGAMVPVGRQFVVLELRYVQGLDDIVDRSDESAAGLSSPSIKYRGLLLIGGFAFTLGGE